jgi:mannose-6-phosphate isomerase-like protein (cupin superfamily)
MQYRRIQMETTTGTTVQPYVLSAGEGEAIWYVNNRATVKATSAQTGGAFGLVEMVVAPNHPIPFHIHHGEAEALWVLEGQLTVLAGEQMYSAGPGSLIFGPKDMPHTFRVEGSTQARLLVLMVPGGGEQFFVEAGRPAEGPGLPEPQPPDLARMQTMMEKFHQEVVGPPLPPA